LSWRAWWLALCAGTALAQPLPQLPDPARLAGQLLGGERGAAIVAIARGTQILRGSASQPERAIDADTALFEIGSVSKVFTGLLLAQAVERGELSLGDTLGQHLPRQTRDTPAAALTLRQLVTHSACLPRTLAADGPDAAAEIRTLTPTQLWDALPQLVLAGQPPCAPRYSNLGMALLGNLLAQHYRQPWEALVRERIAAPLGLADTVQTLDAARRARMLPAFAGEAVAPLWDMDAYAGAGALRSSTADLLRFGQAILAGREGPLGPAAERLLTPLGRYAGGEIGYGILILGSPERRVYLHDGLTGGYRTLWMLMPEGRQVLVASASNARAALPTLRARVLAALFPVPSEPIAVAPAQLAPLTGEYRSEDGTLYRVLLHEGQLYARGGPLGFAPLVAVGPGRFARPERGLLFQFDTAAEPARLTVQQGGAEQQARRSAHGVAMAIPAQGDVADAVGRYRLGNGAVFSIRAEQGQLIARLSQQPAFPVFARPGQRDRYFYEVVPAELQFVRDADGRIDALVLHQNGEHRAERIDAIP
jgi:CubicO group peptidase (beta-lactamase class C family)